MFPRRIVELISHVLKRVHTQTGTHRRFNHTHKLSLTLSLSHSHTLSHTHTLSFVEHARTCIVYMHTDTRTILTHILRHRSPLRSLGIHTRARNCDPKTTHRTAMDDAGALSYLEGALTEVFASTTPPARMQQMEQELSGYRAEPGAWRQCARFIKMTDNPEVHWFAHSVFVSLCSAFFNSGLSLLL